MENLPGCQIVLNRLFSPNWWIDDAISVDGAHRREAKILVVASEFNQWKTI
jgi:hypothetical protein